jgi:hypothetical protein
MRMVDASAFLVTAVSVLVVNAVAAVLAGCSLYVVQYLYQRYLDYSHGALSSRPSVPSIAK